MNHPVFRPLGRLTYCAFICHLFVLRCLTGDLRQPLYVTNTTYVILVSSTVVLSYFLALILCLCIEFPTSAVCKLFLRTDTHPDVVEIKPKATL
jgi:peptidoglycan/LPS O-acetylase OafA/YrhL